jgi:hypothetical protein
MPAHPPQSYRGEFGELFISGRMSQFFGTLFYGQNYFFSCHVFDLSWHLFLPIKKPPVGWLVIFNFLLIFMDGCGAFLILRADVERSRPRLQMFGLNSAITFTGFTKESGVKGQC